MIGKASPCHGRRESYDRLVRALCMSLAYPHGYVMIHIGVCAASQVVISVRAALACSVRGHVRHVQQARIARKPQTCH